MDTSGCGLVDLFRQRFSNPRTLDEFRDYEELLKRKLARCEYRMRLDYLQGDYSYSKLIATLQLAKSSVKNTKRTRVARSQEES